MPRVLPRFLLVLLLLLPGAGLRAEKVADLPVPTTYVNDFAHVLSPGATRSLEDLCTELHQQADAEMVVVTIKTLDDGQSIEEFTAALEEKWKLGKKGEDRSLLLVMSLAPKHLRAETGYGLEGILPDAKAGRILDTALPAAKSGDYDQALKTAAQGFANVIAADKGVTLTPIVHTYHRVPAEQPQGIGVGQIVLGVAFVVLLLILMKTGHLGWAIWLLMNVLGGGGGGGGRNDDRGGGGFGGVGGGGSGGGGASRDF